MTKEKRDNEPYPNWIEAFYIDKSILWGVQCEYNILFAYDLYENRNIEIVDLPMKYRIPSRRFHNIILIDNTIYFLPWFGKTILKYNIKSKLFGEIVINLSDSIKDVMSTGCVYDKRLYMTSVINGVLGLNVGNEKINCITFDEEDYFFPNFSKVKDGYLVSSYHKNKVIEVSSEFEKKKEYIFGDVENRYTASARIDSFIISMLYRGGNVLCSYNTIENKLTKYEIKECVKCENYIGSIVHNKQVIFFPASCGGNIVSFDVESETTDILKPVKTREIYAFSNIFRHNENIYLYEVFNNEIWQYDKNNVLIVNKIEHNEAFLIHAKKISINSGKGIAEKKELNVKDLIEVIIGNNQ